MKRQYGSGHLELRGSIWTLRLRVSNGSKRSKRVRLGTIRELPTRADAERAASFANTVGAHTVASLLRPSRKSQTKRIASFTGSWLSEKLTEQDGRCAICFTTPRRLVVDHDHETGELRGLLCPQCNSGIGMLRDDPSLLRAAILYLENYTSAAFMCPSVPKVEGLSC